MIEFDLFDNLIDFIDELYILIKQDWVKFKLFVKENKNYILWLFIALITLQFTDIMNLGSSWNRYCKKNNIQQGGSNSGSAETATPTADSATPTAETKPAETKPAEQKAEQKAAPATPTATPPETKPATPPATPPAKPEGETKSATSPAETKTNKQAEVKSAETAKTNKPEGEKKTNKPEDEKKTAESEGEKKTNKPTGEKKAGTGNSENKDKEDTVKDIDKKLGFFNKLKGKIKDSAGQHGLAGPVLGNLEGIFGAVGGIFTFAATILIFLGILSLPVLIFLIITYCVIKMMVGKLAIY